MIIVTGSLAFDHIMDFPGKFSDHIMPDKIHAINLSFLVNKLSKQKGGTAGNIAYNLALLGCPVSIVGSVGSDFKEYSKFLEDAGVDISKIKVIEGESTSSAYIMTDKSDNQITAFYPGAMSENSTLSVDPADLVVISPNDPAAMLNFAKQCQSSKTPYMLDPGMQLPSLEPDQLQGMLSGATILIGNDYEISLLKEKLSIDDGKILSQVKIMITTLGEKGSIIQSAGLPDSPSRSQGPPGRWSIQSAKPTHIADPTGAGDAYRAGFIAGYTKGLDLKVCGQMGSTAACYAIEKYGTTNHKFSIEEFCQRYKENFGDEIPY